MLPPDCLFEAYIAGGSGSTDINLPDGAGGRAASDSGNGSFDFDLSDLQVSELYLDAGSGSGDLMLPPDSTFEAYIEGGSGSIDITLPDGVGARVEIDSGSGSFNPDSRFRLVDGERGDDGVWETDDYDSAEYVVELSIDQGSGSVRIH